SMRKVLITTAVIALLSAPALARWDGTKEDCKNANGLEKKTAAWYEVCTSDAQKRTDELRHNLEGKLGSTPSLPTDDPDVVNQGRQHMDTERQNIERAKRNDPRSNKSTITGPIRHDNLNGGGTVPTNRLSRPAFLGGGKKIGGVRIGGGDAEKERG